MEILYNLINCCKTTSIEMLPDIEVNFKYANIIRCKTKRVINEQASKYPNQGGRKYHKESLI